jgi:DnaK suppressor protein
MVKKKKTPAAKTVKKKETKIAPGIKAIRDKLIARKGKVLEELITRKGGSLTTSFKDASGDLSGYSFHMADMATDLYDREFSLELAEEERERLYEIDDAIKRIDEGGYGVCKTCECKITQQRLKVMPEAKNCIKCQEKEEKENISK